MLLAVCQCWWEWEMCFTYCITFNQRLPGPPAQQVLWIFFFLDENNGMQKELQRRGQQMRDWSPLPSNCLVIEERFPLSHYLTCRRGRQMWLSGYQLSPGRMCRGTGRSFPARRPVICFTPVFIFPHDR